MVARGTGEEEREEGKGERRMRVEGNAQPFKFIFTFHFNTIFLKKYLVMCITGKVQAKRSLPVSPALSLPRLKHVLICSAHNNRIL